MSYDAFSYKDSGVKSQESFSKALRPCPDSRLFTPNRYTRLQYISQYLPRLLCPGLENFTVAPKESSTSAFLTP